MPSPTSEWLEADGLGGFASGTVSGERTRRYHGLLLIATTPPTGRMMLVNGIDAFVSTAAGRFALSTQRYTPDAVHPDGASRIEQFSLSPWPRWTFALPDGTRIQQEVFAVHRRPFTVLSWRLLIPAPGVRLEIRPFVSGRDYHSLHHINDAIGFEPERSDRAVSWRLYQGVPVITAISNGHYEHTPDWYRNFFYRAEQNRGLDAVEDLATPGIFSFDLSASEAQLGLTTEPPRVAAAANLDDLRTMERRRRDAFESPLHRAADAYIVERGTGSTIIAGYPWFTDWGRDTFIAFPGICLATGRLATARDVLMTWAAVLSDGMVPNRFPDTGDRPEFNAADASLWFVIAIRLYLDEAARTGTIVAARDRGVLEDAIRQIVDGYANGTRHGIRMTEDGLLAAGEPGVAVTWMDARVGGQVITPRVGKPVEIQCLWINALAIAGSLDARWQQVQRRAMESFNRRFWNDARGCLYDVVDVDHLEGTVDATLRPNQIFAAGGLPLVVASAERARRIVDVVERDLMVPLGLRTLAPAEPGYVGRFGGNIEERDRAYHQGTAWPWLLYALADACAHAKTHDAAAATIATIRETLRGHAEGDGMGHLPEVVSGDLPHAPGGCPFQAWSLAALLRLDQTRT